MEHVIALITGGGQITLVGVCIVCAGLFLAGFVDSIAGGGGLISIPAYMLAGLPVHSVIGTNKLSMGMGTAVTTAKFIMQGFLRWRLCVPCIVVALVGSSLGAQASLLASETALRIVMLAVIPVAAFYVFKNKDLAGNQEHWNPGKELGICCAAALGIGFYDGFYGPGTGTFLMLLLTGAGHLSLNDAAGTTKAINLTTNLTSLVVFLVNGVVLIPLGLLAGCFAIAGNYIGATMFTEKGARIARPIMLIVLTVFAIRLIGQLAGIF